MRRNGFTLIELLVVVVVIGILAAFLFAVFGHRHPPGSAPRWNCRSNLKQIALSFDQYLQDYDGHLPQISAGNQGWAEEIHPYMKSWQILQCPSAENRSDAKAPLTTDYFLNARVAGLKRSRISRGGLTILLGEGLDNGGSNSHLSELPFDWITADNSPAKRHLDGANYAFVDGHVKWLKPNKISTQTPKSKEFIATFAVR